MDSQKELFARIAKLPLEEKIEATYEALEKNAADAMVKKQICRSKLETSEKLALLSKHFGQEIAEDTIFQLQKRERNKNSNLPNTLSLRDYIKSRKDLDVDAQAASRETVDQSVKKFLKAIAAFLDLKRDMNERVSDEDCEIIEAILLVDKYHLYRDQMNRIVHMAFRFQGQQIKKTAFRFFDNVLNHYQDVEVAILFNLLEGDYLSTEMYLILETHKNLILKDEFLSNKVEKELVRIQNAAATKKEKRKIQQLLDLYAEAKIDLKHQQQFLNHTAEAAG